MNAITVKLVASAVIAVAVLATIPMLGFTASSADQRQGMIIDFGYWDVVWTEMTFTGGMNGYDALKAACDIQGYECGILDDGTVYSVNDQVNLIGVKWAFYTLSTDGWAEADPASVDASEHNILCWARASGPDTVIPGVDATGHSYYNYARGSAAGGEGLRVVTLAPSVTEMVAFVGGAGLIIGTDLYSNYPQEIVDAKEDGRISIIGGYTDPNYEWIIKLAPDLVLCDGGTGEHVTMADKLRKSGINCVVLYDGTDLGTLYDNIWIVGCALGLSENANAGNRELRSAVDVVSGIAGRTDKRVFVALSSDPSPWTAGSQTYMSDVISVAGGVGAFDSQSSSWFMVSKEQIYAKQPKAIVIMSSTPVSTEDEYQRLLDSLDPLWKATPAFQNGEVYVFSGDANDILSRPGPRLAEATELMAKILNPEKFISLDPLDVIPKYFDDTYRDYLKYSRGVSA